MKSSLPEPEIEELKRTYPTVKSLDDGETLWFTRLKEEDTRVAQAYEIEHAHWIPGDPWEALLAVYVIGPGEDGVRAAIESALAACRS